MYLSIYWSEWFNLFLISDFSISLFVIGSHDPIIRVDFLVFISPDLQGDLLSPVRRRQLKQGRDQDGASTPQHAGDVLGGGQRRHGESTAPPLTEQHLEGAADEEDGDEIQIGEEVFEDVDAFGVGDSAVEVVEQLHEDKRVEHQTRKLLSRG